MAEHIIDMDSPNQKGLLLSQIRSLNGMHRVTIVKHRPCRTDRQNRFYWPCFVGTFADFLRGQGEPISDDQAHELLKHRFLRKTAIDKESGEHIGDYTRSTTELSTSEFNEYLDAVAAWLHQTFGISIPSPHEYHERELVHHG